MALIVDPRMRILTGDDFNRADGTLGANWTTRGGDEDPQIVSNKLRSKTLDVTAMAGYTGITWPDDQWVQFTYSTVGGATYMDSGLALRTSLTTGACYRGYITGPAGSNKTAEIRSPTTAVIATRSDVTLTAGDVLTLTGLGNTITLWQNSTVLLRIGDTYQSSGVPGVQLYIAAGGSLADMIMDDWVAGDFLTTRSRGVVPDDLGTGMSIGATSKEWW